MNPALKNPNPEKIEISQHLRDAAVRHGARDAAKPADPTPKVELEIPAVEAAKPMTQGRVARVWARAWRADSMRAFRNWWIARVSWPISKRLGVLMCAIGRHDWEDAHVKKPDGVPNLETPPMFKRCIRPACRVYRDTPELLIIRDERNRPLWFEVSDIFEVIARANCPACRGRGYARTMLLPSADPKFRVTTPVPCGCVRVQPRFVKRDPVKGGKG